jgi:cob(I)alamin adenosyltransferase
MDNFYTGAGDEGTTGLLGPQRVPKHHPQIAASGDLDEASAALGLARALTVSPDIRVALLEAQRDLYHLMAEVSAAPEVAAQFRRIDAARVAWLEDQTTLFGGLLPPLREFVVPGDSLAGAALHVARTVVRRAEREVVRLYDEGIVANPELIRYLNRLSSLCFVLALVEDRAAGVAQETLAKDTP